MNHEIAIIHSIEQYGRIADMSSEGISIFLLSHDEIVERLFSADSTFASAYYHDRINMHFVAYALSHSTEYVL